MEPNIPENLINSIIININNSIQNSENVSNNNDENTSENVNNDTNVMNNDTNVMNNDTVVINNNVNEDRNETGDETENEEEDEYETCDEDEDVAGDENEDVVGDENGDIAENTIHQLFHIPEDTLNEMVDNKFNEIMNWVYPNMMNIDDETIKFIDYCYLKNLQYDDEPIDTIRYTIRTIFFEGTHYELKKLVSNIFSYGMLGINYVFNENFSILNELLTSELKRRLKREMVFTLVSQMITNQGSGINQMEDIKLILTKEELEKIPLNSYKNIETELKEKNECCPVCRDEYNDNDIVRILNCCHVFHTDCVDNWLTNHSHKCPCCRQSTGIYKPNI